MPKDISSLRESREIRKQVVAKYGDVPTSVWSMTGTKNPEIITFGRTQTEVSIEKHKKMSYDKSLYKAFHPSSVNIRGKQGGISVFPDELVRKIVSFYSEENDTILDVFSGHNSRMQQTYLMNRTYIGYDICHEFMEFNRLVADKTQKQNRLFENKNKIILHEQSSTHLNESDNYADLIFTSPPYWKLEYYGPEKEQMGNTKTYADFLAMMQETVNECYRVLKPDKFCVFNINDFRCDGVFYTYHADIINLFRTAHFNIHDIVIVKWVNAIGASFASQVESRKVTAKAHEYLIVGKK